MVWDDFHPVVRVELVSGFAIADDLHWLTENGLIGYPIRDRPIQVEPLPGTISATHPYLARNLDQLEDAIASGKLLELNCPFRTS
ncbi:MAG: hypothetical protein RIM23_23380 [Coleofasciculus sp. G3-WIS-01]|uniref:hypothetical protein n=1 Tax=Coleofasciculus sp. G3-WIS-01 TaxID=3069528 RepID=UPI0033013E6D